MGKIIGFGFVALLGLAVIGWYSMAYTVDQTEQAIVLRFGEIRKTVDEPGLYFKLPFADEVVLYEKRILDLDPAPVKQLLTDQKTIEVDAYARYRIIDPLVFFQRVRSYNILEDRFSKLVRAGLQREIANVSLGQLLSDRRVDIMEKIGIEVEQQARSFGIEVVDVRIKRADLPEGQTVKGWIADQRAQFLAAQGVGQRDVKRGWLKFGFPLHYNSDILEAMVALAAAGVPKTPALDKALQASADVGHDVSVVVFDPPATLPEGAISWMVAYRQSATKRCLPSQARPAGYLQGASQDAFTSPGAACSRR